MRSIAGLLSTLLLLATLLGCQPLLQTAAPRFHAEANPERLSDWGLLQVREGRLTLGEGVIRYELASPLFSDYALKLRTIWSPAGPATYDAQEAFAFPVGTVISKTFYYPRGARAGIVQAAQHPGLEGEALKLAGYRLLETRLLVRREAGWVALPYVWNEAQTDAVLKRTGALLPLALERPGEAPEAFAYQVPNANQCAGCHAVDAKSRALSPIGPKARHLNRPSPLAPEENQLEHWTRTGLLTGAPPAAQAPRNAAWDEAGAPLAARARAYLDVNCSHCHSAKGPADTSGLDLEPAAHGPALGLCKAPIAAGRGTGGRAYDIVPGAPEQSILLHRLETTDPGQMMPELGRALAHREGVDLLRDWIAALPGACSA